MPDVYAVAETVVGGARPSRCQTFKCQPSDLATRFELAVNLRAAKAIGFTIRKTSCYAPKAIAIQKTRPLRFGPFRNLALGLLPDPSSIIVQSNQGQTI
jgi:hypothetical protein